jgi:hypothetical protein
LFFGLVEVHGCYLFYRAPSALAEFEKEFIAGGYCLFSDGRIDVKSVMTGIHCGRRPRQAMAAWGREAITLKLGIRSLSSANRSA